MSFFRKERKGGQFDSIPVTLEIENTNDTTSKAVVFGSNKNINKKNFGSDKGITINVVNGDIKYSEILFDSSFTKKLGEIHLMSANSAQPFKTFKLAVDYVNGIGKYKHIKPILDPMQFQSCVSIVRLKTEINASTCLEFNILPKTTFYLSFYYNSEYYFVPSKGRLMLLKLKKNTIDKIVRLFESRIQRIKTKRLIKKISKR